jgi:hypothetical protein
VWMTARPAVCGVGMVRARRILAGRTGAQLVAWLGLPIPVWSCTYIGTGETVTILDHHYGEVTGTVEPAGVGWRLADTGQPDAPWYGHATKVTVVLLNRS